MNEILEYPLYIHPNKDKKSLWRGGCGGAQEHVIYIREQKILMISLEKLWGNWRCSAV